QGHTNTVTSVAYSPDSKTLASGSKDGTLRLWNVQEAKESATLKGNLRAKFKDYSEVKSVAFSHDGRVLACGGGGEVELWDVAARKQEPFDMWPRAKVYSVAFSPNGTILISGASDGDKFWETMRLWDVSSGKSKVIFNGPKRGDVLSVTFSPDGKTI